MNANVGHGHWPSPGTSTAGHAGRTPAAASASLGIRPSSEGIAALSAASFQSHLLPPQHFSGNPLDRTYDKRRKFDGTSKAEEVSLVVVAGRDICVRPSSYSPPTAPGVADTDASGTPPTRTPETSGGGASVGPTDAVRASVPGVGAGAKSGAAGAPSGSANHGSLDLQALLLGATDPELDLNSDSICLTWVNGDSVHQLPLYLLGTDRTERWTFALDVSGCAADFGAYLRECCGLGSGVAMQDLRAALPQLSRDAAAIAGQAVALSQWHQGHRFCPRCGSPTAPVECGLRRQCTGDSGHKLYPRTDPVVIMLVESPDGRRALLGRSRRFTPGMYTCLSGFIDQCESIEEAVRREVFEESRVAVADVAVVGSQPWPVGRSGGCELMLGAVAKARSYEVLVNTDEMEDVQWYDKEELRAAVQLYDRAAGGERQVEEGEEGDEPLSVAQLQEQSLEHLGFFIPPPLAIAHHLIRAWALHPGPWFPMPPPAAPPAPPSTAAAAASSVTLPPTLRAGKL